MTKIENVGCYSIFFHFSTKIDGSLVDYVYYLLRNLNLDKSDFIFTNRNLIGYWNLCI